jgi:hypothetical protein
MAESPQTHANNALWVLKEFNVHRSVEANPKQDTRRCAFSDFERPRRPYLQISCETSDEEVFNVVGVE